MFVLVVVCSCWWLYGRAGGSMVVLVVVCSCWWLYVRAGGCMFVLVVVWSCTVNVHACGDMFVQGFNVHAGDGVVVQG